jgi:hypothetical protein
MKIRRPGRFWSLRATFSLGRVELACWLAVLVLTAALAAGNASTTAGAAASIPAVSGSVRTPAGLRLVTIWPPTESTGYCLKEVIESEPRWPSSHDLINAIDRRCFSQRWHRPRLALSKTTRVPCARPLAWLPRIPPRHVTGCLID